jgi:TonB family protein
MRMGLYLPLILSFGLLQAQAPLPSPAASSVPNSTRLEPIKTAKPHYPDEARDKGLQGRVVIRLHVNEEGKVESTDVVSGDPILAGAASDAFKKWKFKPFIRDGRPVKVATKLPFLFTYAGSSEDFREKPVPMASFAADSSGTPRSSDGAPINKIRVSAGVAQGQLLHKVQPVYPPEAKRKRIQGTVLLRATIGKDGVMKEVRLISGPPELTEAAIGAVQQWRYRPYLLQGSPVEVETMVKITFHM